MPLKERTRTTASHRRTRVLVRMLARSLDDRYPQRRQRFRWRQAGITVKVRPGIWPLQGADCCFGNGPAGGRGGP